MTKIRRIRGRVEEKYKKEEEVQKLKGEKIYKSESVIVNYAKTLENDKLLKESYKEEGNNVVNVATYKESDDNGVTNEKVEKGRDGTNSAVADKGDEVDLSMNTIVETAYAHT
ncbi:hypothetical protein HAX54_027731 [Datura stramonium]|uniref:Uncharacterized protein n=1 Tax=Datura stramonium TaxID=4076 RepID=A0ABS8V310_DATST|nr:hypothetical protein [Datura stramonium]